MSGLLEEMDGLNSALQTGNGTLTADLRAINRQFNAVFTLLLDAMDDARDTAEGGLEGIIQDTSDEDISATREGKVADCSNLGTVEGDRNVGGIAGAVAIEFDLDPEDDTTGRFSFGSSYETKAVLMNCVNRGAVTGKKDCVGGLAGRMDLGTALECQNYGPVASTGGNYVGVWPAMRTPPSAAAMSRAPCPERITSAALPAGPAVCGTAVPSSQSRKARSIWEPLPAA